MRFPRRLLAILFCLTLIPSSALLLRGEDADGDGRPDPPARAARLQYMSGSVSVQPHGTDEWVAGALNRPLTNSDNIWADKNSRAEISLGTGLVRLDSESSLTLTNVDQNTVQLQLHQGAMNLHVRRLYDGETYEVDTPNQAFTVSKPGDYRFDVNSDDDKTVITVWHGEGESTGSGPAVRVREGQQARFADGTNTDAADLHSAPSPDEFDEWASSRDERFDRSASSRYVSPDVVGYEDLDEYGSWRETSQYGAVWVPSRVGVGWAPYRNGHWIWVDPWGWTWVEDEPWGYAPFHYGRWVYNDNYWGWAPGPVYVRPYYAPALVAWFGGPSWGVSVGFGGGYGYGWCPLGFGEPYIPWYGVSRGYFNRVNITNTHITNVNITNIYNNTYINRGGRGGAGGYSPNGGGPYGPRNNIRYANMRSPNGFTAVSRQTLLNSQNVARNAMRVSPNELRRVSPVHSLDMKPTAASRLGATAGMRASAPPPRSFSRPTMSRATASTTGRGNAGTNAQYGIGSRPNWNAGAQRANGPANAERPAVSMNNRGVQRPMGNNSVQRPMNAPDRGVGSANSNVRMAERGPMSPTTNRGTWGRSVPRPPGAGGMNGAGMRSGADTSQRSNVARPSMGNVDRPNPGSMSRPNGGSEMSRSGGPQMRPQSVPRPGGSNFPREYSSAGDRSNFPSARNGSTQVPRPGTSYEANNRGYGNGSVNRPTPSYSPDRGSYGRPSTSTRETPSYSNPPRSYGGGSNRASAPNYGGGSYGRPAPSYDRGSMGRSAPSYGGGGGSMGRSVPSYGGGGRSMGSYGGSRSPAYSGGGGGRSGGFGGGGGGHASAASGGGGRSGGFGGGGGGHASAPSGGGGHNSGGGGGGHGHR
ncbi:MAG TPA: DUF6600 domain-containing protein [Terriglobales bacterium]|nr:DUF6600 domain-containing protein [Terriglobales bacterium]